MATEKHANEILDLYQKILVKNKNISYMAVVPIIDSDNNLTEDFTIEVGVLNKKHQIDLNDKFDIEKNIDNYLSKRGMPENLSMYDITNTILENGLVPKKLIIPSDSYEIDLSINTIEVKIVTSDELKTQTFNDYKRPVKGGCSIMNYKYNAPGTLGAMVKIKNSSELFFISNWHVLTGSIGRNGDHILQPSKYDYGLHPKHSIGTLYWSKLDVHLDIALAKVTNKKNIKSGTRCFGEINGIEKAKVNIEVKKCGRTTRLTNKKVKSVNAAVNIGGYPGGKRCFFNQILIENMTKEGDSGSIVCNSENNKAIGIIIGGDKRTISIANDINKIIGVKIPAFEVKHSNNEIEKMPEIEITGFE